MITLKDGTEIYSLEDAVVASACATNTDDFQEGEIRVMVGVGLLPENGFIPKNTAQDHDFGIDKARISIIV